MVVLVTERTETENLKVPAGAASGADAKKSTNVPAHVAIIMDGNGRWATKNGVGRVKGHNQGMLAMKEIVKKADTMGIKYLTVYAFSTENWKRSKEEVGGIFGLLVKYVASELAELDENNVRVHILGEWKDIPPQAVASIEKALDTTKDNTGLQFNIALNYGSRAEIIRAVKHLAEEAKNGVLEPSEITDDMLSAALYTGAENGDIPDPDLIIRTSGEMRLSNFLMWQAAYSEFAFTDTLWPDFTPDEFASIVEEFTHRSRRFGGR